MIKKLALVIALALPLTAVAGDKTADKPAGAADKPAGASGAEGRTGGSLFGSLDADKDGFVTQTEAKKSAEVSANFKALDADADGKISAKEMGQPK